MKTAKFAVSVQWGNGHHYFIDSGLEEEGAARDLAAQHRRLVEATAKSRTHRGFKPQVFLWKRIVD